MTNDDLEELACAACGMNEEQITKSINDGTVDEAVYERYGVDFDTFAEIAQDLLGFTPVVTTGLTRTKVYAFVKDGVCLVKRPVKNDPD